MEDLAGRKALYQELRKMAICFSIQVSLIAFQLAVYLQGVHFSKALETGPKSYFEIKVSRKVGCVLTSNEV